MQECVSLSWDWRSSWPKMQNQCWLKVRVESEVEQDQLLDEAGPEPETEPLILEPLNMVEIAGGTFWMGSKYFDRKAYGDEKPRRKVAVSDFCIDRNPITRQLYRYILKESPKEWTNNEDDQQLPANYVTWIDAVRFCNALSEQIGFQACYRIEGDQVEWDREADGYRLPTEAEWEYACRAGTTTRWFFGDDPAELGRYAWFTNNSGDRVHPVGEKESNPWGLHDMIGNVWEWCWDWYGEYKKTLDMKDMDRWPRMIRVYYVIGNIILRIPGIGKLLFKDSSDSALHDPIGPKEDRFRVLRGGSFGYLAEVLRSAFRFRNVPGYSDDSVGFRCVRRPRRQP